MTMTYRPMTTPPHSPPADGEDKPSRAERTSAVPVSLAGPERSNNIRIMPMSGVLASTSTAIRYALLGVQCEKLPHGIHADDAAAFVVESIATLTDHRIAVHAVGFSPDGRRWLR